MLKQRALCAAMVLALHLRVLAGDGGPPPVLPNSLPPDLRQGLERFLRAESAAEASLNAAASNAAPEKLFSIGREAFQQRDPSIRFRLLGWNLVEKAAEAGNRDAVLLVALYDSGCLTMAAPREYDDAEIPEERRGESHRPVPKPVEGRAVRYFRQLLPEGHGGTRVQLALLYSSGIGEPRDETETPHNLLVAAARLGDADAMEHLSDRYAYGHGERVDAIEAARWRYCAWRNKDSRRSDWLDARGRAKTQANLPLADVAEVLSLFVRAIELNDAEAESELQRRLRAAGRNPATELRELRSGSMPGSANK